MVNLCYVRLELVSVLLRSLWYPVFTTKAFHSRNKALAECVLRIDKDYCVTSTLLSMTNQPKRVLLTLRHNVFQLTI